MGKFEYYSSLDHLKWSVPEAELDSGSFVSRDQLDEHGRYRVRQWIEENCHSRVVMWNGVETPAYGQNGWGDMVAPQGDGRFYFELEQDRVLFKLTWCYRC